MALANGNWHNATPRRSRGRATSRFLNPLEWKNFLWKPDAFEVGTYGKLAPSRGAFGTRWGHSNMPTVVQRRAFRSAHSRIHFIRSSHSWRLIVDSFHSLSCTTQCNIGRRPCVLLQKPSRPGRLDLPGTPLTGPIALRQPPTADGPALLAASDAPGHLTVVAGALSNQSHWPIQIYLRNAGLLSGG